MLVLYAIYHPPESFLPVFNECVVETRILVSVEVPEVYPDFIYERILYMASIPI